MKSEVCQIITIYRSPRTRGDKEEEHEHMGMGGVFVCVWVSL